MKIEFTKMHGIGNDYIYVNCLQRDLPDPCALAAAINAPTESEPSAEASECKCRSARRIIGGISFPEQIFQICVPRSGIPRLTQPVFDGRTEKIRSGGEGFPEFSFFEIVRAL